MRQRFGVIALGSAWVHQGGRSAVVWDAFPRSKNTIYPYNNETMGGCCPPPLSSGVSTLVWREARWLVEVQRAKVIVPVDGVVGARVVARRRGKTRRKRAGTWALTVCSEDQVSFRLGTLPSKKRKKQRGWGYL